MHLNRASLMSTCLALATLGGAALADDLPPLDAPESAHWHAPSQSWYVSSLGGGMSVARDGIGWISRYSAAGQLLEARWVEGLDAPTGMTSHGGMLYAVDRAGVLEIDIEARRVLRTIVLPDAVTPNDIAVADDGTLFVSDMAGNRIYRILPGATATLWVSDAALEGPNGLWMDGERLLVATWGPAKEQGSIETTRPGRLLAVNLDHGSIQVLFNGQSIGHLDGLVGLDDALYVTDWMTGTLLRVAPTGAVSTVMTGLPGLADLGVDPTGRVIGLPAMQDNRLVLLNLGETSP
ncbi:MAG: SMP-30/gluconolactonase/LRE family protein [Steroidobacteraceae bacterium]